VAPALPLHALDRSGSAPLPAQLAAQVRGLVADGTLPRGHRLPGSRALATELGVSRAVVEQAYEQLLAEGWVTSRQGSGTFVEAGGLAVRAPRPAARESAAPARLALDTGTPWIDPRHGAGWRRAWREVAASRPPAGYDDPCGLPALREALADHLARTRGLVVRPEEVMTTAGTTDALRHLLLALGPGDVAVEDPGYRAAAVMAGALGRTVVPLEPGRAPATLEGCAAAYLTPAHQHPLGLVLPAPQRLALLEVARAASTLVVEDDYDSEFRWDVAPVPALAALDRDQVAYVGTASKSVAPSLRLGWVVAPPEVHERVAAVRRATHDAVPWAVQKAFAVLLRDGYVDKVVRSARREYAARLPRVVQALAPYGELAGPPAGMYAT
jgi:GntR family transcriptional regulator/MocR family aminotransferase